MFAANVTAVFNPFLTFLLLCFGCVEKSKALTGLLFLVRVAKLSLDNCLLGEGFNKQSAV